MAEMPKAQSHGSDWIPLIVGSYLQISYSKQQYMYLLLIYF